MVETMCTGMADLSTTYLIGGVHGQSSLIFFGDKVFLSPSRNASSQPSRRIHDSPKGVHKKRAQKRRRTRKIKREKNNVIDYSVNKHVYEHREEKRKVRSVTLVSHSITGKESGVRAISK
jgi:hypothetical protein